jgi:hypothetical protein
MSVTATANPLEIVRGFTEACAAGKPEDAAHLVHPHIRFRALIANGNDQQLSGRDALVAEYRAFIDHYGQPEPLHQNVEQVGSLYRWSTRWRMTKDGEASLFEWHGYMAVEDGLITRFDEVCTGRQPEA